jgi:hypothetical protein
MVTQAAILAVGAAAMFAYDAMSETGARGRMEGLLCIAAVEKLRARIA